MDDRHEHYILNEANEAISIDDVLGWARWFEANRERRRVERTDLGDAEVSTVFLGSNHNLYDGPPEIFETLVFGGPLDQEMERYSTWDEAVSGHAAMVDRVKQSRTNTKQEPTDV